MAFFRWGESVLKKSQQLGEAFEMKIKRQVRDVIKKTGDQVMKESRLEGPMTPYRMGERLLEKLRPHAALLSSLTGAAAMVEMIEEELAAQFARFYDVSFSTATWRLERAQLGLRPLERWNAVSELLFFMPIVGMLVKATWGEQILEAIGRAILEAYQKNSQN